MSEHPMLTVMLEASEEAWEYRSLGAVEDAKVNAAATLKWLADPANLSDDVVEESAKSMFGFDWPKDKWERLGDGHHQDRYRGMAKAAITAMINALIKEIEGYEKGGAS